MSRAWRGRLLAAALLLLSTSFSLGLAEGVVRYLRPEYHQGQDPIRNPFWVHDERLGWKHVPGARGTFEREEFSHPVVINSAGWRDRERSRVREPGLFRIAVLGDSFTWGHGVADEAIFTRLMERQRGDLEILNFGLSGSATDQQLLILREHVLAFRPDLVLVMVSRNDFAAVLEGAEGSYYKPRFDLTPRGDLKLEGVPVPERSALSRWHYRLRLRSALLNLIESRFETPEQQDPARGERSRALLRGLLSAMADESKSHGAGFAIGVVPSNAHTYIHPLPEGERKRLGILREIAGTVGFPMLDLVPAFREAAVDPRTGERVDLHFRRDQHWNEKGHALVAQELLRLLEEAGLIPDAGEKAPL